PGRASPSSFGRSASRSGSSDGAAAGRRPARPREPQSGQAPRDRRALSPLRHRNDLGRFPGARRARRDRRDVRGKRRAEGAVGGSGRRAAGACRRFGARGPGARRRARHLFGALGRSRQGFPDRDGEGRGTPRRRKRPARVFRRGADPRLARPARRNLPRRSARPPRLAAAGRQGLRLRPDLSRRWRERNLRRDGPGEEAPDEPSCSSVRETRHHLLGVSFALYVHWPFCRSKCPYCDFNSHVRDSIDETGWRKALLAELDHFASETAGRELASVFFGGGTPSLMSPATVASILDRAAARWRLADDIEVTLEANPTSAEAGKFAGFHAAGVNRVSLGVQALDDAALRTLGRRDRKSVG